MNKLRTPGERFADLPGYRFAPNLVGFGKSGKPTEKTDYSYERQVAWMQAAIITELTTAEIAAYDAPFPDDSYTEGARILPSLVPTRPDDPATAANNAAWDVFKQWHRPFITCFSDSDPVTAGGDKPFLKLVPGALGQPHVTVANAHHFFQEDAAPQLAQIIIDATENTAG
ncbi:hypothetical protein JYT35_00360 [Acidimicrobium ferrooxidans]|uniref:Haloalkane dehalogenase n=1 Tax=Acidimicrobium ferrooxidans TaxID=53635 RepID=A0ABS3AQF4_9ACTN|nr:hypothetical protein [Acidimicrobium ferrooxidans]